MITCLLICEYLSALRAKSEEHGLVAKLVNYDPEDLCCSWRPFRLDVILYVVYALYCGLSTVLNHLF